MTGTQYKVISAEKPKPCPRSLLYISGERSLVASLDAFGIDDFNHNVLEMEKQYLHPITKELISFREPTTAESILIMSYDFKNRVKNQIFPNRLQVGQIVIVSEGIFVNPPKDEYGNPVTCEETLKSYLNKVEPVKVGGGNIYIVPNVENLRDFGFTDYESFQRGMDGEDTFSQGGLARVLEHTINPAVNLKNIVSTNGYLKELYILGFENSGLGPNKSKYLPELRVVCFCSSGGLGLRYDRLEVNGYADTNTYGYAFGVLS